MFQVQRNDDATALVITGLMVMRFGVPMIGGGYATVSTGATTTITFMINRVVPGAQYRIVAWVLASGTSKSATPAVEYVTKREASELPLCTAMYVCLHSLTAHSATVSRLLHAAYIGYTTHYSLKVISYPFYCTTSWKCSMVI